MPDEFPTPFDTFHKAYPRSLFLLLGAKPAGPVIGRLDGRDIAETIVDIDGNRYVYRGLTPQRCDGQADLKRLDPGQYLLEPRFVYELVPSPSIRRPRQSFLRYLRYVLRVGASLMRGAIGKLPVRLEKARHFALKN